MREQFLEIVICSCGSNSFTINTNLTDNNEIREGEVICGKCGYRYKIRDGIIDFMGTPTSQISDELRANLRELNEYKRGFGDEWILNLPFSPNFAFKKDYLFGGNALLQDVDMLIQTLNLSQGMRVLDLGAGTCWTTNRLAATGADCVALDISREKFIGLESGDVFINHSKNYFERMLSSMEILPFKNESFDVVFAGASLHHSPDIKKVLSECFRILKPNGLFTATSERCKGILDKPKNIDIKKAIEDGLVVVEGAHENIYNIFEYVEMLTSSNFKSRIYFSPSTFLWETRNPLINTENANRKTKTLLRLAGIIILLRPLANFLVPFTRFFRRVSYYINILFSEFSITIIGKKIGSDIENSAHK